MSVLHILAINGTLCAIGVLLRLASVDWLSVAIRIRLPLCECLALFSKSCRYSSAFNRVIASALKLRVNIYVNMFVLL